MVTVPLLIITPLLKPISSAANYFLETFSALFTLALSETTYIPSFKRSNFVITKSPFVYYTTTLIFLKSSLANSKKYCKVVLLNALIEAIVS
jgi:hypothetical protein